MKPPGFRLRVLGVLGVFIMGFRVFRVFLMGFRLFRVCIVFPLLHWRVGGLSK